MNQTHPDPLKGALFMIAAGIAFALANALTQIVTFHLGFKPQSDTFWQYAIALVLAFPFVWREGLAGFRTDHPVLHVLRVIVSAFGVQAFVMALANGVPIWQVIALVMTSPFFVMLGAFLFLGERVGPNRWGAAALGFAGAMVLLRPWDQGFSPAALYPLAAALLWAAASLLTKRLTRTERPQTVTLWLLALLTPINAGLSVQAGFEWPTGTILLALLAGGVLMLAAQHMLTMAYASADAAFVQPFDDLKLLSNILVGWLIFGYLPEGTLWLGVAMILAASSWLLWSEREGRSPGLAARPAQETA
ncbi:DMT family transporter [Neotabrizicola shimadae]|uniref:DMT family transporter n=1 Tax=Neotabrizicola shimadae TaxID=2807096 RepID=A0A8G0ZWW2_9RHOB|nr:DMT family transporter [Neotabrizicola shimadae]QYZ70185.1 DMT family transporter [Neotabrizicola shimadae]